MQSINPDILILPAWNATNGHICTQYQNLTVIAENGDLCYQVSNGSWIASASRIGFYGTSDLTRIFAAGAILLVAVAVITYAVYKVWQTRYMNWVRRTEIEEKLAAGEKFDPNEYPEIPGAGLGKLFFIAGILIIIIGGILFVLPM